MSTAIKNQKRKKRAKIIIVSFRVQTQNINSILEMEAQLPDFHLSQLIYNSNF